MTYSEFKDNCTKQISLQGKDLRLKQLSAEWFQSSCVYQYSYNFEFLGRPIIQYPQDIVQMQELIYQIKPDLIIETGIAYGGSVVMSASSLCTLDIMEGLDPRLSSRRVIGIDIDIRDNNRAALSEHPLSFKYELIEGSSIDQNIAAQVGDIAQNYKKVMVFLDSNHTHDHVLNELRLYANLVSIGSYIVVFDTGIELLPSGSFTDRPWDIGNNPMTALDAWLPDNPNFSVDSAIDDKLLVTVAPKGYIKRIA